MQTHRCHCLTTFKVVFFSFIYWLYSIICILDAGRNYNVLDDEIIFVQRESIAGPVESEVEDETSDSPAIESVENEVQHDPLSKLSHVIFQNA